MIGSLMPCWSPERGMHCSGGAMAGAGGSITAGAPAPRLPKAAITSMRALSSCISVARQVLSCRPLRKTCA